MVIPVSPGEGFIYMNESWNWNMGAHAYEPTPERWVKEKKSSVWVDGSWKKTKAGWKFKKGYWKNK
jgi:hypothetical protein